MEVYKVESKKTGKRVFIAAWEDAGTCWKDQLALLRRGTHPTKLQEHFNKFGEDDLEMSIVKKLPDAEVTKFLVKYLVNEPREPEKVEPVHIEIIPKVNMEKLESTLKKRGRKK